jgi:hypothetical protein
MQLKLTSEQTTKKERNRKERQSDNICGPWEKRKEKRSAEKEQDKYVKWERRTERDYVELVWKERESNLYEILREQNKKFWIMF